MDSIRCKIIKSERKVQWKLHNGKFYDSLKTLLTESDKTFSDNSYIAVVFHKDNMNADQGMALKFIICAFFSRSSATFELSPFLYNGL